MSEQDDDQFSGNLSEYDIRCDRVLKSKDFSAIVKQLIAEMQVNPYKTVGQFIQNISDDDLHTLLTKIDRDDLEEILLLSEILCRAEGVHTEDIDQVVRNVNLLTLLIAGESLSRRGLTTSVYENMSFGDDCKDKPIFKKIEQNE